MWLDEAGRCRSIINSLLHKAEKFCCVLIIMYVCNFIKMKGEGATLRGRDSLSGEATVRIIFEGKNWLPGTKMATLPIYGKNPLKIFSRTKNCPTPGITCFT